MDNKEDFVKLIELLSKYIYNLSKCELSTNRTASDEFLRLLGEQKSCAHKIMSECIMLFDDKDNIDYNNMIPIEIIENKLEKYKGIRKYHVDNYKGNTLSGIKVQAKLELLKEILKDIREM